MPRNIEVKLPLADRAATESRVAALPGITGPEQIAQDDTFFVSPNGRLKLRVFADGSGVLIFYQRADEAGPKTSHYTLSAVPEPETMRQVLTAAWGDAGRVQKQRTLYLCGRTRIHLDKVIGLGDFLELETVLADEDDIASGVAEASQLLHALGLEGVPQIKGAYLDLLRQRATR